MRRFPSPSRFLLGIALLLACVPSRADVVVVVSAQNPLASLDTDQVSALFLGKTSTPSDGPPLEPVNQAEGSAMRDEFQTRFLGKTAAQVRSYWSKVIFSGKGRPPVEVPEDGAVRRYIATHPNAVGYLDRSQVDKGLRIIAVPDR
jgi:ABC-type phosphate transport system substrate-binding protein